MIELLNIGSIVFGLVACILPIINLARSNQENRNWIAPMFISIISCLVAFYFQFFSYFQLIRNEDWITLSETTVVITVGSIFLFTITVFLNTLTLYVYRNKK